MPERKFVIELRVEADDEERFDVVARVCKQVARDLYAQAGLVCPRANIGFMTVDFFMGPKELNIHDENEDNTFTKEATKGA